MNKKLQLYFNVEDGVYRTVSMNAVLTVNDSQIVYEAREDRPTGTRDSDIAADCVRWAVGIADEYDTAVEYGSNLNTTISSVHNLEHLKLTKIEDRDNAAFKANVLTEVREDKIARAGLVG